MNPNYVYTITLYNCIKAKDSGTTKDIWRKTILKDCFYKAGVTIVQNGDAVSKANTYTVRIPEDIRFLRYPNYCKDPEGHFTASTGDIVILGECSDEITDDLPAVKMLIRHKPDAFMVSAFSDNTGHFAGRHYKLGG